MDYDDNEFQGQNLQLAGEGSTKFPPDLRPYALPKFDFDDSLHGHLRFDSLVETEVFLGIESNVDNQWIEDFSRGSSGIEFRTSAAESCSISRHNNVWSEAASSESVEMLLKSVGQEDNIPAKPIIRELDACDELGCLIRQMDSSSNLDDGSLSTSKDVINASSTLPSNEILSSFSGLKEDASESQEQHPVDVSSQKIEGESSGSGDLIDPIPNDVSGMSSLPHTEGITIPDPKQANTKQANTIVESSDNGMERDSPALAKHVDSSSTCPQNTSTISVELNTLEVLNRKSEDIYKNVDDFQTDSGVHGMEYPSVREAETNEHVMKYPSVQGAETNEHGMEYPSGQEAETNEQDLDGKVVERADIKISATDAEELSHKMLKGDSDSLTVEGAQKPENQALLDSGISDPLKVNMIKSPGMDTKHDNIIETPIGELNNVNNIEAASLSMEDKISKAEVDQSSINHGRDISTVEVECSKLLRETQTAVTSRGDDGCSVVTGDVSNANSNDSSFNLYGPTEICEEVKNFGQTDALKCDESLSKEVKEKIELPSTCTSNECEVAESCMDKRVESASLGKVITTNELTPKSISNSTSGYKLESVHLQSINTANADSICLEVQKKDGCHDERPSDSQGMLKEAIHDQKNGMENRTHVLERKTVDGDGVVLLAISDKQEEIAREENIEKLSMEVSGAASELKKNEFPAQTLASSSEGIHCGVGPIDQEDSKTLYVDEKLEQIEVPKTDGSPPGATVEVQKDIIDSTQTESDPKIHVLDSGSCCIDPDESTCGSPTIIRATEESPSEKEKMEIKGVINPNVSGAEAIEAINTDANKVSFVSSNAKENDASKGEKNFTFEVSSTTELPTIEAGKNWQPFTTTQASKPLPNAEGSPLISTVGQLNSKVVQDVAKGSPQVSNKESGRSGTKGTSERKSRRPSSKATGKESAKRGNNVKGTTSARQLEKRDKTSNASPSPSGIGQRVQSSEMPHYGLVDGSNVKPFGVLGTPTSTLPDLNTSSASVFQQPFTDLQQVQLRAQIFVYGALIQGAAPDETYMSSAFGGPDGGKSIWEAAWRACIERLHGQKSILNNTETPLQSRSGVRAPDPTIKHGSTQGKVASSPLGRTISKSTPSPIVNSMIPLSSPLWSVPTPSGDALKSGVMSRGPVMDYSQTVSPLHPQQTPVRNFVGHNTWISQSPFRATWVASPPATAIDTSSRFPVLPFSETAQHTPMKDPSLPLSSGVKPVSSGPLIQSASAVSVFPGTSPILDSRKVSGSSSQHSDAKPRKRKKTPVSEDSSKILVPPQSQTETVLAPISFTHMSVSAPIGITHMTSSVSSTIPASLVSKVSSEKVVPVLPTNSNDQILKIDGELRQKVTLSDETFTNLKEARAQAEDASASAAAAVSHSQELWNQLDRQKNSGLVPDVESKLAYAAVMIAAAAAVARAAAAAANVASNAALQAKLMADEAFKSSSCSESNEMLFGLEKATPASILKGENLKSSSSAIILAAREAARRNVEAASAASKRAENMDAIVKAAELAAEAVSQAGTIVGMGDHLSLNDLLEAGMNGYWRPAQVSAGLVANSGDSNVRRLDSIRGLGTSTMQSKEAPPDKRETHTTNQETLATGESLGESIDDHTRLVEGIPSSLVSSVKSTKGQRGVKASDLAKTIGVVPESEIGSKSSSITIQIEQGKEGEPLKEGSIKEGSHVEVFKEGSQCKAAWFTAKVLSLKDENAYVCYTELTSDEGSEKIKEWVSLKTEGDKAPKVRIARPIAALPSEGTRKRRRTAISGYTWSVGDRVDAWMRDSWWEGVVTEKSKKDETTYAVYFEGQGETATVRVWHLRPSLIWKDGEWVESSSSIDASNEVDTRQEKRLRMGSTAADGKGKDKISKVTGVVEAEKSDEPRLLDLCMNEKVFNIGKSTVSESKPQTLRMMRTGLQKEGSRVVFGVPKPGKKRKFMDVSKHYVDQGSKVSESSNDSMKFTKYLMPQGQGSGSRGWKNVSKSEPKEKRAGFAKSKIPKSGKPPSVSNRTIMQKENSPAVSASDDIAGVDRSEKMKDLAGNVNDASEKRDEIELQSLSSSGGAAGNSMVFSSMPLSSEAPSKKVSSSNTRTERITKGKLAPAGGRLTKINEEKVSNDVSTKSTSDVVEPRRSNRRIQPTSRLLEGLQSSLIIAKIPSGSHDRGHKNQNRSTSRGNNHG